MSVPEIVEFDNVAEDLPIQNKCLHLKCARTKIWMTREKILLLSQRLHVLEKFYPRF